MFRVTRWPKVGDNSTSFMISHKNISRITNIEYIIVTNIAKVPEIFDISLILIDHLLRFYLKLKKNMFTTYKG